METKIVSIFGKKELKSGIRIEEKDQEKKSLTILSKLRGLQQISVKNAELGMVN